MLIVSCCRTAILFLCSTICSLCLGELPLPFKEIASGELKYSVQDRETGEKHLCTVRWTLGYKLYSDENLGAKTKTTNVSTPQGNYVINEGTAPQIRFSPPGQAVIQNDLPTFYPTIEPNLPLGNVLRKSKQISTQSYILSDGSEIDYFEDRAERYVKTQSGRDVIGTYEYGPTSMGPTGAYRSKCHIVLGTKGKEGYSDRDIIIQEFKAIGEHDLDYLLDHWLKEGYFIDENRTQPPVGWEYSSLLKANGDSNVLTPSRLLELSKGPSQYFEKQRALKAKANESRGSGNMLSWLVFVVSAGLLIFALFLPRLAKYYRSWRK